MCVQDDLITIEYFTSIVITANAIFSLCEAQVVSSGSEYVIHWQSAECDVFMQILSCGRWGALCNAIVCTLDMVMNSLHRMKLILLSDYK